MPLPEAKLLHDGQRRDERPMPPRPPVAWFAYERGKVMSGGQDDDYWGEAGRRDAIAFLEQEVFAAIAPTTPRSEWRKVMGVSEERLRELGRLCGRRQRTF